jgi:S-adenosylmethionine uptake transporter
MRKYFRWFSLKGYFQGVFWISLVSVVSISNDIIIRLLGDHLPSIEIAFFRFLFSALTILPVLIFKMNVVLHTSYPFFHFFRSFLGFAAIALWCYGVGNNPLAIVSAIALTVPLFVLPMSYFFLNESVNLQRVSATCIGFIGVLLIVFSKNNVKIFFSDIISIEALELVFAAIFFAISDIFNKILLKTESFFTLLFYFAIGTTCISLFPVYVVWVFPTMLEACYLIILGLGSNLILFCLLKAFVSVEVSALSPYRYLELVFAASVGFFLFSEIPSLNACIGILLIIPSTFAITYYEVNRRD